MNLNELANGNIKLIVVDDSKMDTTDSHLCEITINRHFYNLISGTSIKQNPEIKVALTQREKEVLTKVAKGKGNKEIGKELSITVHTVRAHLNNIFEKLHVKGRTTAVVKAVKYNLINIYDE